MGYIRYQSRLVHRISMDELLSALHPDAPAPPWSSEGREACSFMVRPVQNGEPLIVLLDAYGDEIPAIIDRPDHPIAQTILALRPAFNAVTFLPKAHVPEREEDAPPRIEPAAIPRSTEGEGLSIVPGKHTQAGWFGEANVIAITDGERTALYEPFRVLKE